MNINSDQILDRSDSKLLEIWSTFLLLLKWVDENIHKNFCDELFVIFLNKYWYWKTLQKQKSHIKQDDEFQSLALEWMTAMIWFFLLINKWEYSLDDFLKNYTHSISKDNWFLEKEIRKIIPTFEKHYQSLIVSENVLWALRSEVQSKTHIVMNLNLHFRKLHDNSYRTVLSNSWLGIDALNWSKLLWEKWSFLDSLDIIAETPMTQIQEFEFLHRKRKLTQRSYEYYSKIDQASEFKNLPEERQDLRCRDWQVYSILENIVKWKNHYIPELELSFLSPDGVIDFYQLSSFYKTYIAWKEDQILSGNIQFMHSHQKSNPEIVAELKSNTCSFKYEKIIECIEKQGAYIASFEKKDVFDIYVPLREWDNYLRVNYTEWVLEASTYHFWIINSRFTCSKHDEVVYDWEAREIINIRKKFTDRLINAIDVNELGDLQSHVNWLWFSFKNSVQDLLTVDEIEIFANNATVGFLEMLQNIRVGWAKKGAFLSNFQTIHSLKFPTIEAVEIEKLFKQRWSKQFTNSHFFRDYLGLTGNETWEVEYDNPQELLAKMYLDRDNSFKYRKYLAHIFLKSQDEVDDILMELEKVTDDSHLIWKIFYWEFDQEIENHQWKDVEENKFSKSMISWLSKNMLNDGLRIKVKKRILSFDDSSSAFDYIFWLYISQTLWFINGREKFYIQKIESFEKEQIAGELMGNPDEFIEILFRTRQITDEGFNYIQSLMESLVVDLEWRKKITHSDFWLICILHEFDYIKDLDIFFHKLDIYKISRYLSKKYIGYPINNAVAAKIIKLAWIAVFKDNKKIGNRESQMSLWRSKIAKLRWRIKDPKITQQDQLVCEAEIWRLGQEMADLRKERDKILSKYGSIMIGQRSTISLVQISWKCKTSYERFFVPKNQSKKSPKSESSLKKNSYIHDGNNNWKWMIQERIVRIVDQLKLTNQWKKNVVSDQVWQEQIEMMFTQEYIQWLKPWKLFNCFQYFCEKEWWQISEQTYLLFLERFRSLSEWSIIREASYELYSLFVFLWIPTWDSEFFDSKIYNDMLTLMPWWKACETRLKRSYVHVDEKI